MGLYEVITEAVVSWYEETGIKADTLLLHPRDCNDLLMEISTQSAGYQTDLALSNPRTVISAPVGSLEVKVAVQEVSGEFVISNSSTREMRRFTFLESSDDLDPISDTKVLLVKRSNLFLRRDAKNQFFRGIDAGWSENLLHEVSENWDQVIVFHDVHRQHEGIWPDQHLVDLVKSLGLQNVEVISYNSHQQLEAVQIWKKCILGVGGKIKRVPNIKDINCFSIPKLTVGKHLTWIDQNGDFDLGIVVEKAKSFLDLAKERESQIEW